MIFRGEIVLLLVVISTIYGEDEIKCPDVSKLGCKCSPELKSLVCEQNTTNPLTLPDITGLEVLTINGTKLETIKIPDSYTTLKELTLEGNTKLKTIDWKKETDKIVIDNNPAFDLEAFLLAGSSDITHLQIIKQNLTEIKSEYLDKFPELVSLYVKSSHVKTLAPGLLKGRDKFAELSLPFNEIETIADSLAIDVGKKTINLDSNKITAEQVGKSGLDQSKVQVSIYVSNNRIEDFTAEHFKAIAANAIIALYLEDNPIQCKYKDIEWIFNDPLVRIHILHPQCKDYNNRELFSIDQYDFVDGPPRPTTEGSTTPAPVTTQTHATTNATSY